jgi:hypothetical protein
MEFVKSPTCDNSGSCLEVAFQKACQSDGCVEAAIKDDEVLVRDSKFATRGEESPYLRFSRKDWQDLLDAVRGNHAIEPADGAVVITLHADAGDGNPWYLMTKGGDNTVGLFFNQQEIDDFEKGVLSSDTFNLPVAA